MDEPTHYQVLGVARTADRETIRKAYISIARASHPDRQSGQFADRVSAEARIRAANAAWTTLGDPIKRAEYDLSLPMQRRPQAPQPPLRNLDDDRPPPPSGIVVSAHTAALWVWIPVLVAVAIGALLLIGSAYATSRDSGSASAPVTTESPRFSVGQCVAITAGPSGKNAQVASCDAPLTGVIASVTETPRPCPSGTTEFQLFDRKTTLCVVAQS